METRRMWIGGSGGGRYVELPKDAADAMSRLSELVLQRARAKDLVDDLYRADARGENSVNPRQLLFRHGFVDTPERTEQ
jgi:hypothetical protein